MLDTEQLYKRPPITEAVLEFRLRERLDDDVISRIARRSQSRFAYVHDEFVTQVQLNELNANVTQGKIGKN
jgi:hypothetical protein